MEQNYTMADLLAEFGDRFDIYEEIGKENQRLYNPELVQEEPAQAETIQEEVKEERPKDNTPKDITIKCKKCEKEWIWTVADQKFYKEKGFYKPSICKECRKKMKVVNNFHKD